MMITIYGMPSCPDCSYLDEQIAGKSEFTFIDIGAKSTNLKEFLKVRDLSNQFDSLRGTGGIGIPCFVREDGSVTLVPEEVGLVSRPADSEESATPAPAACSDGAAGEETEEYTTFQTKNKDGETIEMAVVDEFEYEKKSYVVGALIEGDEINEDGLYIFKASVKDGELQAEKISNPKEYEKIAAAYLEIEKNV